MIDNAPDFLAQHPLFKNLADLAAALEYARVTKIDGREAIIQFNNPEELAVFQVAVDFVQNYHKTP